MQTPYRKPGKFAATPLDPLMTEEKVKEVEQKLEKLKGKQPQAAAEVARLAELGDFSENAEYQLAKGRLRGINHNILILENELRHAVVIEPGAKTNSVKVGQSVTIETNNVKKIYQILGSSETNPAKGIISHNSPIGNALVGRKVGDLVTVQLAGKEVEYKIISFE